MTQKERKAGYLLFRIFFYCSIVVAVEAVVGVTYMLTHSYEELNKPMAEWLALIVFVPFLILLFLFVLIVLFNIITGEKVPDPDNPNAY